MFAVGVQGRRAGTHGFLPLGLVTRPARALPWPAAPGDRYGRALVIVAAGVLCRSLANREVAALFLRRRRITKSRDGKSSTGLLKLLLADYLNS